MKRLVRIPRNIAWEVVTLLGIASLFYIPYWLAGELYGSFDLVHITAPIEDIFARYQSAASIPVWAPELQGGFPLMANGFQSFFYLPHLLLRTIVPGIWVVNISLLLHMWLAGIGMWLLIREIRLERMAALISAIVFSSGGYLIGRITLPHLFFPVAWIPFILYALFRAWKRPTVGTLVLVAAAFSAQIFAGHIQVAVYTAGVLAIAGLVLFFSTPRSQAVRRLPFSLVIVGLVILLTAVHVLPVQELLPLSRRGEATQAEEAFDVSYPLQHVLTWAEPKIFGTGSLYRGAKNEPELMMYFGISGLLVGLVSIWSRPLWSHPLGRTAILVIVTGFVLAAGGYSPIYRWLHGLPTPLAGLANPGRAIILVHVGWSILMAFGVSGLYRSSRQKRVLALAAACVIVAAVVFIVLRGLDPAVRDVVVKNFFQQRVSIILYVLLTSLLIVLPHRWSGRVAGAFCIVVIIELLGVGISMNPVVPQNIWRQPPLIAQDVPVDSAAPRIYSHETIIPVPQSDFSPEVGPTVVADTIIKQTVIPQSQPLTSVLIDLTWDTQTPLPGRVSLRLLDGSGQQLRASEVPGDKITALELTKFSFAALPDVAGRQLIMELLSSYKGKQSPKIIMRTNRGNSDYDPTGRLEICPKQACAPVVTGDTADEVDLAFGLEYEAPPIILARELLVPIFGEGLGKKMVRGHLTLQTMRMYQYLFNLGERGDFEAENLVSSRDLLDRLSVGTLVAAFSPHRELAGMDNVTLVKKVPLAAREIHVYRNNQAYPRVQAAGVQTVTNAKDALTALTSSSVPRDRVVVENLVPPSELGKDKQPTIRLTQDEPRDVEIRTHSTSPQFVVLRDVLYPGWQATIDNQPTSLYFTDVLFRGLVVPPGEHTIHYTFRNVAFKRGLIISLLSWLGIVAVMMVRRVRNHKLPFLQ